MLELHYSPNISELERRWQQLTICVCKLTRNPLQPALFKNLLDYVHTVPSRGASTPVQFKQSELTRAAGGGGALKSADYLFPHSAVMKRPDPESKLDAPALPRHDAFSIVLDKFRWSGRRSGEGSLGFSVCFVV